MISQTYFIDRTITRAARHLDILLAAQTNKIPREAAKLRALVSLMKDNAAAYAKVFASQSVLGQDEFNAAVKLRVQEIRDQQFAEARRVRELRKQHEEERAMLLASGDLLAA